MSQSQFLLEVYKPGSTSTVVGCWPCAAPIHIAVGDVLRTGAIDPDALPSTTLRVVRIEHGLWPRNGELAHKLMVFTELP
jgi:hypothetical protein